MDAVAYLTTDHRAVEHLLADLESASPRDRVELLQQVTTKLSRHMSAEETVLFPLIREELEHLEDDVKHEVLEKLEEHHVLKTVLEELNDLDPDDERFGAKTEVLAEQVEHHHEEEEEDLFPLLREHLRQDRLVAIADALREAETTAPTRPHPNLPDEGTAAEVAQKAAGVVDRARDKVRAKVDELTDR